MWVLYGYVDPHFIKKGSPGKALRDARKSSTNKISSYEEENVPQVSD